MKCRCFSQSCDRPCLFLDGARLVHVDVASTAAHHDRHAEQVVNEWVHRGETHELEVHDVRTETEKRQMPQVVAERGAFRARIGMAHLVQRLASVTCATP